LKGATQSLLHEAPASRLAKVEAEIEEKSQLAEEDKLRADALRLLAMTRSSVIEEATADVAKPIAEEASHIFQKIAGSKFAGLKIDADLCVKGIRRSGDPSIVEVGKLSGGEREQVYLSLRIALAKVLTQPDGKRELLVIDDALAATDQERLARAMRILLDLQGKIQTLVLTCHPERYTGLEGVKLIEMEDLLLAS